MESEMSKAVKAHNAINYWRTRAEGVERQFQVDALRTLGCDTMQGYYFGKPHADPMKVAQIRKEDWEDRSPSTAPRNPSDLRSVS